MRTFYHVTPTRNVRSILKLGLVAKRAIGLRKAVWMVKKSMISWALVHVALRHGTPLERLSVVRVRVRADVVRQHRGRLSYVGQDVPPDDIVTVRSVRELSWV